MLISLQLRLANVLGQESYLVERFEVVDPSPSVKIAQIPPQPTRSIKIVNFDH